MAKREMNEALKVRVQHYSDLSLKSSNDGHIRDSAFYRDMASELEKFRAFARNALLWDTRRGE